jgi:diguanylate cyclase (GGDEF)-like protein
MEIERQQIHHLLVIEDNQGKRRLVLNSATYLIGRDLTNSIVLHSNFVSRQHAILLRVTTSEAATYLFRIIDGDLQGRRSANGLMVNGQPCSSQDLKHGDVILFGADAKIRYYAISNLSDAEFLEYCKAEHLTGRLAESPDPIQNLVPPNVDLGSLSEKALVRLASFPELIPNPILEIGLTGSLMYLNPAAVAQFPNIQEVGTACEPSLQHPILKGLLTAVQNEKKNVFVREVEVGNQVFEQSVHYLPESDLIRSYVVDITERKRAEEMIQYQALHDLLTGLSNRTLFNHQLSLALANAHRNGEMLAVLFLDLDRFKTINDTLGHTVGDQLLQGVTKRLASCLREGDIVARWGGDEFTLLLSHVSHVDDATQTAQIILDTLQPAFEIEDHQLHITSSIGVVLYPYDGEDVQTLLANADVGLHRAKEQGRNQYQLYTPAMNSQASKLLTLENSLHKALECGEFVVYYQPQVNIFTWEITQMEALVRWQHPELGLISPKTFIPLAEENGLIVPIGEWVLQTACAQNAAWHKAGFSPLRVAVNLSARQFQQPNLVKVVARVLEEMELEPHLMELEITETTAMQNVDFTSAMLYDLHQMGVHISLDDFGTGYSSLSYLKIFPFDTIKIDQSFIQDLTTDPKGAAIIAAVITLGRSLGLRIVAEGVETKEQLDCLRSLQCTEMQGHLFWKPLSAEEATKLLQAYWLDKKQVFTALDEFIVQLPPSFFSTR